MHFWPLGIVILGTGLSAIVMIVLMIKIQQPGATAKSPHHRTNLRSDLIAAHDHAIAVEQEETATLSAEHEQGRLKADDGSLVDHSA